MKHKTIQESYILLNNVMHLVHGTLMDVGGNFKHGAERGYVDCGSGGGHECVVVVPEDDDDRIGGGSGYYLDAGGGCDDGRGNTDKMGMVVMVIVTELE